MGHPGLLVTLVEGSDHPYRGEEDNCVCLLLRCSGEGVSAGVPQLVVQEVKARLPFGRSGEAVTASVP